MLEDYIYFVLWCDHCLNKEKQEATVAVIFSV